MGYGTGAIMAVPGGDVRDYAFAEAFDCKAGDAMVRENQCEVW